MTLSSINISYILHTFHILYVCANIEHNEIEMLLVCGMDTATVYSDQRF